MKFSELFDNSFRSDVSVPSGLWESVQYCMHWFTQVCVKYSKDCPKILSESGTFLDSPFGAFDKSQLRSLKSNVTHIQCDIHSSLCYKSFKRTDTVTYQRRISSRITPQTSKLRNKPVVFLVWTVINTVCLCMFTCSDIFTSTECTVCFKPSDWNLYQSCYWATSDDIQDFTYQNHFNVSV